MVKSNDIKFFRCENIEHREEILEISNDKSLEAMVKLKSIDSTYNSKSWRDDVVRNLNMIIKNK